MTSGQETEQALFHPMGCETQLAWKCLFVSTFFGWRFDP